MKFFLINPVIVVFLIISSLPSDAHAYIDPGAGNALLSIILVVIGSATFFLKSAWFRIVKVFKRNKQPKLELERLPSRNAGSYEHEIVLFSEGRLYHQTFEPIVKEFISQRTKVFYVSMDIHDPLLALHDEFFDARYLGEGGMGFARFERISARLMIATTPNIGIEGYPIKRPKNVKILAHVCHAVSGVANYRKYSLDSYDVVLMSGPFMLSEIRSLEKLRGGRMKQCVSVGLPYLDDLLRKAELSACKNESSQNQKTILIAPSWGKKDFLKTTGLHFIERLNEQGYSIILRPHPYSLIHEPDYIETLKLKLSEFNSVEFDFNVDGTESLYRARVLISGRSAVRFDFAFVYQKPVVSVRIPEPEDQSFESSDLEEIWDDSAERKIGPVVEGNFTEAIPLAVEKALMMDISKIETFKLEAVPQFGSASRHVYQNCVDLVKLDLINAAVH